MSFGKGLSAKNMAALDLVGRGLGKENWRAQDYANAKLAVRAAGKGKQHRVETRRAKVDMARALRPLSKQPLP